MVREAQTGPSLEGLGERPDPLGLLGDPEDSDRHPRCLKTPILGQSDGEALDGPVVLHDGLGLLLHEAQVHLHRPRPLT